MIEQGIYFALGSIVTALLALLFAPVFWHRALRLTRQRLQLQVPLSMQEILSERDQLRAEFAVERLRVEQAMERVQATKGQDMAEIGRRSMEATALAEQLAGLRQVEQAQDAEIARLLREVGEHGAENGALRLALHDDHAELDLWRQRAETARDQHERLQDEVDSHRTTIASLKTRSMGLEMRLTDAERARVAREKELETGLRARLETAMGHVARHESAGILLRRELDDAKAHIRQLEDELQSAQAAAGDAREREKVHQIQRSLQPDMAKPGDRLADRLDLMAAENAALRGALTAARREGAEAPGAATDAADSDASLRASIHALGLAVAKLTRHAREAPSLADDGPRRPVVEGTSRPVGVA